MLGFHGNSSTAFLGEGELLVKLNENLEVYYRINGKKLDNLGK